MKRQWRPTASSTIYKAVTEAIAENTRKWYNFVVTPTSSTATTYPTLSRPQEYLDAILADVDPDLMSVNLPFLDARAIGETLEQRQKRLDRYQAALDVCDALVVDLQRATEEYEAATKAASLHSASQ